MVCCRIHRDLNRVKYTGYSRCTSTLVTFKSTAKSIHGSVNASQCGRTKHFRKAGNKHLLLISEVWLNNLRLTTRLQSPKLNPCPFQKIISRSAAKTDCKQVAIFPMLPVAEPMWKDKILPKFNHDHLNSLTQLYSVI